jgi:signal transduction histidine kinase
MSRPSIYSFKKYLPILGGIIVFVGLYLAKLYSYRLFLSLAELFSVAVAFSIFALAWNSREFTDNNYVLFVGMAFLAVATLDLLHLLAYPGMGIFHRNEHDLSSQLWIAARFLQSTAFLIAPVFIRRKLKAEYALSGYIVATALILLAIFVFDIFPLSYAQGMGTTAFATASEYVICGVFLLAIVQLVRNRESFDRRVFLLLAASLSVSIVSEIAFAAYSNHYGFINMLGHYLIIISFYLIYRATIRTGLQQPYSLLFRGLKQNEEKLTEANAELEAFTYSVSHDLRAPLRAVDGFSRILDEEHSEALDVEGRRFLGLIQKNADYMGRLIEGLLALSKVGRQEIRIYTIDMNTLATEVCEQQLALFPGRTINLTIHDLPQATGDPLLIKQVMVNLVSNAFKYSSSREHPRIEIGGATEGRYQEYWVRDNGVGFDMNYSDKLFGVFQRLHSSDGFEGTGVGLSLVKRIVQRHGGKVWAEGVVGSGATFFFSLSSRSKNRSNSTLADRSKGGRSY